VRIVGQSELGQFNCVPSSRRGGYGEPMKLSWCVIAVIAWLSVTLVSCNSSSGDTSAAPAEPPLGGGGSTDPAFDWEQVPARPVVYSYPTPVFKSTKTLDQTTRWLQWALERYGSNVRSPVFRSDISGVRFRGCSMEWSENAELGGGVTRLRRYEINLGNITKAEGEDDYTKVDLDQEIRPEERIFEGGKEKPSSGMAESYVQLPVRDEDQISHRISWALLHASRLCAGAR
jgi:hypothetical protein